MANAQGVSSSTFAGAFARFGQARVLNEIFIPDLGHPRIAVLLDERTRMSISIISLDNREWRSVWHLPQIQDFMAVIDPRNVRVLTTENGPIVLLHGCASHLCGGKGLAGALVYVINTNHLYTAYASYNGSTHTTEFVYTPESPTSESMAQKQYLMKCCARNTTSPEFWVPHEPAKY
jgi:hypothetical protein